MINCGSRYIDLYLASDVDHLFCDAPTISVCSSVKFGYFIGRLYLVNLLNF